MRDDLAPAVWRKSTYSSTQGACVEVAILDNGHRAVRDSKDTIGRTLKFTTAAWCAFMTGIRSGEFD